MAHLHSLSMAMCGAVKQGSALLVNWRCVDTRLTCNSCWPDLPLVPGRRATAISLELESPDGECTIHPLGRGGYCEIARAYRDLARDKGWRRTWAEKRKDYRSVDRMFGAADFKPFVLSRVVPGSRFNQGKKELVHLGFTFDEVARCAEHWRHDLGIDRAFVVLAGWINRGYDVGHPDVLPAAPECGGNEGLARAAARIKACGYAFGLHDNYQDMYEDAPSWGQQWLNKNERGVSKKGGNWAGGQAWQVCAVKQVELAARPATNLPQIARLFGPTIYFIDTVFAWGLVTCEDPAHPMTRLDDLRWKTRLCLLAKQHFGLFGSEEGREWAVPCADYLEGIFGHQTDSPPGTVIPLFPLVYNDCAAIMTHQSNRIAAGDEKKMADHILFAQMSLPHFGTHLYWRQPSTDGVKMAPLPAEVKTLDSRKLAITYRWKVDGPIPFDGNFFVHFTHPKGKRAEGIAFQNDHAPRTPLSRWRPGIVDDGPYTVEVPRDASGRVEILVGLLHNGQRVSFHHTPGEGGRHLVGTLDIRGGQIEYQPARPVEHVELWSRGDGGWGEKPLPRRPGDQKHVGGAQSAEHDRRPTPVGPPRVPHRRPPGAAYTLRRPDRHRGLREAGPRGRTGRAGPRLHHRESRLRGLLRNALQRSRLRRTGAVHRPEPGRPADRRVGARADLPRLRRPADQALRQGVSRGARRDRAREMNGTLLRDSPTFVECREVPFGSVSGGPSRGDEPRRDTTFAF